MEDFRARRKAAAQQKGQVPGIEWISKIDGKNMKTGHDRKSTQRGTETKVIGDFAFADDTGIVGEATEALAAEKILCETMLDWHEKVHPGKTEGLRLGNMPRCPTDVRYHGETATVRHVGGWLN
jgi:hypothetical protein